MYIPHGAVMDRWMPVATGRDLELPPILRRLRPWRERLNIVSGLTLPAAYVGEATAGANHTRSSHCWLTCTPVGTGARRRRSADQVAARHIGQETPLPSLELALESGESIAYLTPQTPLPMETNPRVVFERLFGDGSTPEERAARQRQFVEPARFRSGRSCAAAARTARPRIASAWTAISTTCASSSGDSHSPPIRR